MVKIKKYLLILGIISLFLIAACGQQVDTVQEEEGHEHGVDDVHDDEADDSASLGVPAEGHEDVEEIVVEDSESSIKEFDLIAKQWEFIPPVITVNKGDNVVLNIKSTDVAHGFKISEFNVDQKLIPGKTEVVKFIADKKGEFSFFCNVYCGADHADMKGKLIVE